MSDQIQLTEDQHYVPRFYIKLFSHIKQTKKKEKGFASFYRFRDGLEKQGVPVESICYKKFFYGEDCSVENSLSKKEGVWASVFHKLRDSQFTSIDEGDVKILKEFATYQYARTKAMLNHQKYGMEKMLITALKNAYRTQYPNQPYTEDVSQKIESAIHNKVEAESTADLLVENCDQMVSELDSLDICVVKFETLHKLIVSDMPVIMTNPYQTIQSGMNRIGTVLLFPASENALILFYKKEVFPSLKHFMTVKNEKDVIALNKYQILSAEEIIISKNLETLADAIAQDDILKDRNDFVARQKVYAQATQDGTFFAMVGTGIPFIYPLSFLTLAKELKRVPEFLRCPISASYDSAFRNRLLCQIYGELFSEQSHEHLSAADSRRIKGHLKELLKFLDSYWAVPREQQTITPEQMLVLKHAEPPHLTFF